MALAFNTSLRNAQAQAIIDAADAGSGPATITIYSGSRPASGGSETTVLAVLTCNATFGVASGGVVTLNAVTQDSSADNTGTATWFRVKDSDSNWVIDGSVAEGSGGDLNLDETAIVAGGTVSISSPRTITIGNA